MGLDATVHRDDECRYDERILHHRLGNVATVEFLRNELSAAADLFPVLLSRVLYDGTHCGDSLDRATVAKLTPELDRLDGFACADPTNQGLLDTFAAEMRELVAASDRTGRPIDF